MRSIQEPGQPDNRTRFPNLSERIELQCANYWAKEALREGLRKTWLTNNK